MHWGAGDDSVGAVAAEQAVKRARLGADAASPDGVVNALARAEAQYSKQKLQGMFTVDCCKHDCSSPTWPCLPQGAMQQHFVVLQALLKQPYLTMRTSSGNATTCQHALSARAHMSDMAHVLSFAPACMGHCESIPTCMCILAIRFQCH